MTTINITCPAGTSGVAVEPWSPGEVYAVAADWSQASAPVWFYGSQGWDVRWYQVADFGHSALAALRLEIADTLAASEGIPSEDVDDDEVDAILDDAERIDDAEAD